MKKWKNGKSNKINSIINKIFLFVTIGKLFIIAAKTVQSTTTKWPIQNTLPLQKKVN